jgi:hypothetical protein
VGLASPSPAVSALVARRLEQRRKLPGNLSS